MTRGGASEDGSCNECGSPDLIGGSIIVDVPAVEYTYVLNAPHVQMSVLLDVPAVEYSYTIPNPYILDYEVIDFTPKDYPPEQVEDAQLLDADGYIDLFMITLSDKVSTMYLKADNEVTWQGNTYEGTGIKLSNVGEYSDEESARPKLNLANPDGVFTFPISQGHLEGGTITRIRVLKHHLLNDINISTRRSWKVARVASVTRNAVGLELRGVLDGPYSQIPRRMYIPPEFPFVNLS